MNKQLQKLKAGFSLVEVCLAVLVVGLGLLSIFSLFPTGLAASEAATADTEMGLFAEQVLLGLQAQATEVSWDNWKKNAFSIPDISKTISSTKEISVGIIPKKNDKGNLGYTLNISTGTVATIRQATLTVMPWRGPENALTPKILEDNGTVFYTEVYYMELP
jgi:Tfp pilus assembly protein PilV